MSETLKACPFCKSRAHLCVEGEPGHENCWVGCDACDTAGPSARNPEAAMTAWNTRPTDTDKALRAALEGAVCILNNVSRGPSEQDVTDAGAWIDEYAPQYSDAALAKAKEQSARVD